MLLILQFFAAMVAVLLYLAARNFPQWGQRSKISSKISQTKGEATAIQPKSIWPVIRSSIRERTMTPTNI